MINSTARSDMRRKMCPIFLMIALLVLSCGGGGGGGGSADVTIMPEPPANVLSTGGNGQNMLSWSETSEAKSYNVYWSTAAGVTKATGTKISGASSPYYHTGLTNDTTYYYVVTAVNSIGESAESVQVNATPTYNAAPLPPKEVVAIGFNRKAIIRWTPADSEDENTSYNLYWSLNTGVTKSTGTKITNAVSPYTHNGLSNGTVYYYVVTAVNQYGESVESWQVLATPEQGEVPSAPSTVTAVAGDRQATITWNNVERATDYNLYWSTSPDVSSITGKKIAHVKNPYTHTGLTQGKTNYYVITAENGFGESDDSEKASVFIPDSRKDICVAMGDSITAGDSASSYAKSYVPLLSTRWAKTIINASAGGAYSSYGASTIDDLLYQHNPAYLTIYLGTNDAGLADPDTTISNLQYIVEKAKDNGTIPVIATIGPCFDEWAWRKPYVIDLSQRIRQLAASEGIACADIEAALGWNRSYMANSLHPNDAGHGIIADTFYKALTR